MVSLSALKVWRLIFFSPSTLVMYRFMHTSVPPGIDQNKLAEFRCADRTYAWHEQEKFVSEACDRLKNESQFAPTLYSPLKDKDTFEIPGSYYLVPVQRQNQPGKLGQFSSKQPCVPGAIESLCQSYYTIC